MSDYNSVKEYLENTKQQTHEKDFEVKDIKIAVDKILGKTIHGLNNARKRRLRNMAEDYSDLEHINTGRMTLKGVLYSSVFSGLSLTTPFGTSKPILDFSDKGLATTIEAFKEVPKTFSEYQEILTFMSENFINAASTELTVTAFQFTLAAGAYATTAYINNGLKRNEQIENICKEVNKKVRHENFSLKHASDVFKALDSFYEYRSMAAIFGKNTKQFIKDIAAPVLYGLKNNVANPILDKVKDIFGNQRCNDLVKSLKDLTPNMIKKFFKNDNTVTINDMLIYIDKKFNESKLNNPVNEPINLDIQKEVSKVAKDVYETMQLTQTRRALILASKEYIDSIKKIEKLKQEGGVVNKFKINKEERKANKNMQLLKKIENLEELSKKEGRLSRFTLVSRTATKVINNLKSNSNNSYLRRNITLQELSKKINKEIYNEENEIKKIFKNVSNTQYADDIDKMLMPKTYSFERIFKEKVDEMIENKVNEINQRRNKTVNKLKT